MADQANTPIFDPDRTFRVWNINEIYQGPGTGRYVPNIDDMVVDWQAGFFRVTGIDNATLRTTLTPWTLPGSDSGAVERDILLGVDIGQEAESFRALIDTSVTPHRLSLDGRLHVHRRTASHVKVFEGHDVGTGSTVISAMYDSNGDYVGENIPLERTLAPRTRSDDMGMGDDWVNEGVYAPQAGYTLKALPNGTPVTAVFYDDLANPLSLSVLLVQNTRFIRRSEANRRYITGIHLESPFLSTTQSRTIEFPSNMPTSSLPLTGVVSYSDGEQRRLPANSGQFNILGGKDFVSNTAGEKTDMVLVYYLADDEYSNVPSEGTGRFITKTYQAVSVPFDSAYSLKLFAYPSWQDDIYGYKLKFYLMSLDRSRITDVTNLVETNQNSPAFRPLTYGVIQNMVFGLDMNKVDSRYPKYRHVEPIDIVLQGPGTASNNLWEIGFAADQVPRFGAGIRADVGMVNTNLWTLQLANGLATQEEWLNHFYYATLPLYHYQQEANPPTPNIFSVRTATQSFDFNVEQWNEVLTFINDLDQGELLTIVFIRRTYEKDLFLSVAGVPVNRVNPPSNY